MAVNEWDNPAAESFVAASELFRDERPRSATSRAYYAAYQVAVAALVDTGLTMPARGNPTHARMPDLMMNHLNRLSGGRRGNMAGVFTQLYRLRIAADYQPLLTIDQTDARDALGLMSQVFRDAKEARP